MPDEIPVVEARPAADAPPTETSSAVELPDDLLRIPAVQAITVGQPAAFSALLTEFEKLPEGKIIAKNKDSLLRAGFNLYRSLDANTGVVFNALYISGEDIKAADTAGQLSQVAPPFNELNQQIAGSGANNPVLAEGERPTGFATGSGNPAPALPPTASLPARSGGLPAGAQKGLANARSKNLQPGVPTSGASPGSGRLLNSILKPIL